MDFKQAYDFFVKWYKEILFGLIFIVFMQTCSNSCSVSSGFDSTGDSIVSVKNDLDTLKDGNDVLILKLDSIGRSNLTEDEFRELNGKFVEELLEFENAIDENRIDVSDVEIKIEGNHIDK